MKPSVYLETTIPSYLTSRDLVHAARQQITGEWWNHRVEFDLYSSRLVVQECQACDAEAAADRLAAIAEIPLLAVVTEVSELAEALIRGVPLLEKFVADWLHIAIATVHGMMYLLTWNCTHIPNFLRPQIEAVCRAAGFEPPLICTPAQLCLEHSWKIQS
jgi:hypothetical protein